MEQNTPYSNNRTQGSSKAPYTHDMASDGSDEDNSYYGTQSVVCKINLEQKLPMEGGEKGGCADEAEGPDGGWGWVVVLACCVLQIIAGAASANFGILFSEFLIGLNTSSTLTAWIYNLGLVLSAFCCYLVDPLVEEFGWRAASIAMGVMMSVGMSLSAFATSAFDLFFSYSLLASIPVEIIMTVSHAIVPQYFSRRMTLACSLTSCGGSLSLLVMPILLSFLLNEYGFSGATLIMGAITLNICAASMVFYPVEWQSKATCPAKSVAQQSVEDGSTCSRICSSFKRVMKTAQGNLWLFRSVRAVIINSILTINTMAFSNFLYLVPFAMVDEGHSTEEAGVVVSVAGFALLATRFIYPPIFIYFKMRHQVGVNSSSVIIATSIIVFAWTPGLWAKTISMAVLGVGVGMFFTSYCLVVVEILGLPLLTSMLSISGVFKGVFVIIFGPFVGWMRDITDSYPVSLSVLGIILFVTAALWISLPAARKFDLTHGDQMANYEQIQEIENKKKKEKKNNNEEFPLLNDGVQRPYLDSAK
ncbi:monocarboxylate transporter 12-B-like isoform X2 [Eriocheir sinensis]|uniref:monocarboxylate transporter 12-B-like isoform X2 n=1 Tax=Eriocheir sinensis TaxID=95602 RepID=UPI0021C65B59|nr:monocarboxylate transporter 12-B-like isoform X2 [Eriocheir sinensis]